MSTRLRASKVLPVTVGACGLIVMAVTGIHAGLTSESIGSVQASSGHGVTVTPGHPTAQLGQTVGEEPLDVTTTAAAGGH